MNEWSRTRKRNALLIAVVVLVLLLAAPVYFFFQVQPTCFDNKQNGSETGIDCGGSCTVLCSSQSLPLILKGDPRVLQVSTSTYEVVAYVQNPNVTGKVMKANYTFTLYEASSSLPVQTIRGFAYVPNGSNFALFEGPVDLGDKRPNRATLTWDESSLHWIKNDTSLPNITIEDGGVTHASTSPRIDATVTNASLTPVAHVSLITLVFDDTGTIAAASKTYLDELGAGKSTPATFTWPQGFTFVPASVLIIPTVLPDSTYVR